MNPDEKSVDSVLDVKSDNEINEKLEDVTLDNMTDKDLAIKAVEEGNIAELKKVFEGKSKKKIRRLVNMEITWLIELGQLYLIPLYLYKIEMSPTSKHLTNPPDNKDQQKPTRTLLSIACFNEYYNIAKYLIENCGADVNTAGSDGFPPLWYAIAKVNVEIVILLLSHGAKTTTDTAYTTALHFACFCGSLEIVNILIEHGKDFNLVDKFDKTPIIAAAKHLHIKIVERLLSRPKLQMPDDKVNAYQLMGAISVRRENISEALRCWKIAFNTKKKTKNTTKSSTTKNSPSSSTSTPAHNYVKEIDSLRAIDKLKHDYDQLDRQQIHFFFKILGPLHNYTMSSIMSCAEDYVQSLEVYNYLELWNYITDFQKPLSAELYRLEMLYGIRKFMELGLEYWKSFSYVDLVKAFEKAVSEVKRLYDMIEKFPNDRERDNRMGQIVLIEFEGILCCTLNFAISTIAMKKSHNNEILWTKFLEAVDDLVEINPKSAQGRSIMHLSHCQTYSDKCILFDNYVRYHDKNNPKMDTMSLELTEILLESGANPNELDNNLSTPLHYVAVSARDDTDFAELLLRNGAHLDFRDAAGVTYEILLNNKLLFDSLMPFNRTTLMCLAAHVINSIDVKEYHDMVPENLIDFVNRHC